MPEALLARLADGRTDLVLGWVAEGRSATATDAVGRRLIEWCAYYGDVSAVRFLLDHGASLASLGPDLGLSGAAFPGHWRLCEFLLENGAEVNRADEATGETALHRAAAFGGEETIDLLLGAGARRDARDANGDTPLGAASWYGRPDAILRKLLHGEHRIHPDRKPMASSLLGRPRGGGR